MTSSLDKEALRSKALIDSETVAEKSRFGLFSCPLTTAVGDDGPYKTKLRKFLLTQIQETKPANPKPVPEESSPIPPKLANSKKVSSVI